MMPIRKALFKACLRITYPIKYNYPMIKNAKWYCEQYGSSYKDSDLAIMKKNFYEEARDGAKHIGTAQFNYFIQRTMGRSLHTRDLYFLFDELDKDRDGQISFEDILQHFENQFQPQSDRRLKKVFCIYDKDEDGKIKVHELREILFHLGFFVSRSSSIDKLFDKRDPKNKRKIDYEEFKKFMKEDIPSLVKK